MNIIVKSAFASLVTVLSSVACVAPGENLNSGTDGGSSPDVCELMSPCKSGDVCKKDKTIVCAPCLGAWLPKAKSDELCSNDADAGAGGSSGAGGTSGSGGVATDLCKNVSCSHGETCHTFDGKAKCMADGAGGTGGNTGSGGSPGTSCDPNPCSSGNECHTLDGKVICTPVGGTGGSPGSGGNTGSGGTPSAGTRTLEVHFTGNAVGSPSNHRYCMGSPITKGYTGPDSEKTDMWMPWPGQVITPQNDQTWLSMHGDVYMSSAEFVKTITIPADTSLEFQCYDEKKGALTNWGCVSPSIVGVTVKENGKDLSINLVDNLYGSKNCRVY